ncbi:selenocysteine-specific translation elongation factor [hydrocarbon metagenome]|uniref:Selenocysteine-specific elongation factor n=1 Tax=hydrocarbon metagenome TaxID=938273 RepID=A0A0W8E6U3_9ZZZZ
MKRLVLGTAGHIDHGKTTLVRALTGIETDRLKEEKQRGISIELGFAPFILPDGQKAAIVDVPGHERFIKHMLAGAFGIDMVIFVIAADEGVMPQTREHMDIIELLGIQTGIIALTKKDMVDEDWLMLVEEEVREYIAGTILKGAPVIAVSAVTGEGLPELIHEIQRLSEQVAEKSAFGKARLPVDRVFTKAGFGTVVTGTMWSGQMDTGEILELMPSGKKVKIRTLQVHNDKVDTAYAGQRVAVNLQGIDVADIERGNWLSTPGYLSPTYRMDARLRLLESSSRILKNWNRIRFHLGTDETMARIVLLDQDELHPGQEGYVQIVMEKPVVGHKGDPFVIRYYSPVTTIGGGTIIDPNASKQKRFKEETLNELIVKEEGNLSEMLLYELESNPQDVISIDELSKRTGNVEEKIRTELKLLLEENKVVTLKKDEYMSTYGLYQFADKIITALKEYHQKYPLRQGHSREEFRSRFLKNVNTKTYNLILKELEEEGQIETRNNQIRLPGHIPAPGEADLKAIKIIEQEMRDSLFAPPSLDVLRQAAQVDEARFSEIIAYLTEKQVLIKVSQDMFFLQEAIEEGKNRLNSYFARERELSLAAFRDLLDTTRKYALPMIEYYDKIRFTHRVGDARVKT